MVNEHIRCEKKALRSALEHRVIKKMSKQIAQNFLETKMFKEASHVAYYLPIGGEVDTQWLTQWSVGKDFYLPLVKASDGLLVFAKADSTSDYQKNKFGILEPVGTDYVTTLETLDLVVTPLVSYDNEGNRLGMGGGYYDRTFAYKKGQKSKPLLIGYAYSFQYSSAIEVQDWDIPLDGVVTEKGFSLF